MACWMGEITYLKPKGPGTTPQRGQHTVGRTWQPSCLLGKSEVTVMGGWTQVGSSLLRKSSRGISPPPHAFDKHRRGDILS